MTKLEQLSEDMMRNILGGTGTEPPPDPEFPVDPPEGTMEMGGDPIL